MAELKKKAVTKTKKVAKPKKVIVNLQRDRYDGKGGVIGTLSYKDKFVAYTLELEWDDNKQRKSCIPKGEYLLKFRDFGGYYERYKRKFNDHEAGMIEITNVDGRGDILIHIGNTVADTLGCVLVGQEVDSVKSMVYNSTKAYSLNVYPLLAKLLKENKEVYLKIS
jgi:hypothetical protein